MRTMPRQEYIMGNHATSLQKPLQLSHITPAPIEPMHQQDAYYRLLCIVECGCVLWHLGCRHSMYPLMDVLRCSTLTIDTFQQGNGYKLPHQPIPPNLPKMQHIF